MYRLCKCIVVFSYFRASFGLVSHPVVQEFLGMYSEVVDFKEQISELFANKGK